MNCCLTWSTEPAAGDAYRSALRCAALRAGCRNTHDLRRLSAYRCHRTSSTLLLPWHLSCREPAKKIRVRRVSRDRKTIMADPYPIRPIASSEYAAYRLVHEHAFHNGPLAGSPGCGWRAGSSRRTGRWPRFDPALPDSAGPVGITGVYSFRMSVPGAVLPDRGRHLRRGAAHPPAARHPSLADAPPAHRHRGEGRSRSRRCGPRRRRCTGATGTGGRRSQASFRFRRGEGALSAVAPVDPALRCGSPNRRRPPRSSPRSTTTRWRGSRASPPGTTTGGTGCSSTRRRIEGASPLRCVLAEDDSGPRGYTLYRGKRRLGRRHASCPTASSTSGSWSPPTRRPAPRSGRTCSAGTW